MKKDADFQIKEFLDENSHLFTIMGIFGALSVYLNTLNLESIPTTASTMLQVGIVSSLSLFVLVSVIIFFSAFKSHGERPIPLSFFIPLTIGKFIRILFIVPFYLLVVAVFYFVVTAFPGSSNLVFGYTLSWIAIIVFFGFLKLMEPLKSKVIFVLLLFLAVISIFGQLYATKYDFVLGAFFCNSIACGSVIGLIIIPIVGLYKKYKKKDKLNNKPIPKL